MTVSPSPADADDESDEAESRPSERRTRSQKLRRTEVRRGAERKLNGAAAAGDVAPGSDDGQGECYTLFMASSNWYLFLRLHHILCERLNKIYERAVIMASEEEQHKKLRTESTAIALRLKPKSE